MQVKQAAKHVSKYKKIFLVVTSPVVSSLMAISALGVLTTGTPSAQSLFGTPLAEAQNFSQRTIQGKVVGEDDAHVTGATVFLKNVKTRGVKSFTSTPDGSFRFAQVGMIDDYEVWAELGSKKSAVKTVSSFDSRKQVDYVLKLK